MPRILIAAVSLMTALSLSAAESADALLNRGLQAYRVASYAAAATDLEAAAKAYVATDRIAAYVSSGQFESLPYFETALVYLALSHFRLGHEDAAREAIQRLVAAERVSPAYATLPLTTDVADFESIAAALVPDSALPRNMQLAAEDPSRPLPAVKRAIETTPAERQQLAEALVPRERENVWATTPAPPAPMTAAAPQSASSPATRDALSTLRTAEDAANGGDVGRARTVYAGIAQTAAVSREAIVEAAIGLYRVGAFRESAAAFRRVGTFARGEEDLRYYFAVALYESGEYRAAEQELACALPFLEATEDVVRYRWKIENTAAVVAMK